jgi:hypothetical protein
MIKLGAEIHKGPFRGVFYPFSDVSGKASRTRVVVFEMQSVFWQQHIGSYFSFPNQLKEVITILIGFNLGPRANT